MFNSNMVYRSPSSEYDSIDERISNPIDSNDIIRTSSFENSQDNFKSVSLYSDTSYVEQDEDENILLTAYIPKYKFWKSEPMMENYFGLSLFLLTLIFSLFDVDLSYDITWGNNTNIQITQNVVLYPFLIVVTLIMIYTQHKVLNRKRYIRFYLIFFPLIIVSDILGNFYLFKNNGFGSTIFCVLFGLLYRIFFDLTRRFHYVEISKLQGLPFSHENFAKIAVIIFTVDFSTMGLYMAKSLLISWIIPFITLLFILLFGYKLIDANVGMIFAVGIATTGSSAALIIGNLLNFNINGLRRITTIMMLLILLNINCIPLLSEKFNLKSTTEGAWVSSSVDSLGAALGSGSLGNIDVIQYTLISKLLNMMLIGPIYLIINILWLGERKYYMLWKLFPKFIFGFILTSVVVTLLPNKIQDVTVNNCFFVSQWFLKMGLILIGFDINLQILIYIKQYWKLFLLFGVGKFIDILFGIATVYFLYQM